jgi:membrane-associated phospholipid phosphatase
MCFGLADGAQFRPAGPPPLNSAQYAADLNLVKSLGAANSTNRTAEQTLIARFWSDFSYTVTPPGHWNQIAQNVATNNGLSVEQNARLFALLNIAMADAGIAVWDAKYIYNFWRPITAIQQADVDGNAETIADVEWTPLLTTPSFPEYVSGHSAFSAAAATVLARFFGADNVPFTVGSDSVSGVMRSYASFAAAAEEIGMSRIYGGIHFLSADLDALNLGRKIGEYVESNFLLPLGGQPVIAQLRPVGDVVHFRIDGTAGSPCVLESSGNLRDWMSFQTNTTPFDFQEPLAGAMRFYRARLLR